MFRRAATSLTDSCACSVALSVLSLTVPNPICCMSCAVVTGSATGGVISSIDIYFFFFPVNFSATCLGRVSSVTVSPTRTALLSTVPPDANPGLAFVVPRYPPASTGAASVGSPKCALGPPEFDQIERGPVVEIANLAHIAAVQKFYIHRSRRPISLSS